MFRHTELKNQTYWFKHTESIDSVCLILLIKTINILIRTYWINQFSIIEPYWLKFINIPIPPYWINRFSMWNCIELTNITYWSYINNIQMAAKWIGFFFKLAVISLNFYSGCSAPSSLPSSSQDSVHEHSNETQSKPNSSIMSIVMK